MVLSFGGTLASEKGDAEMRGVRDSKCESWARSHIEPPKLRRAVRESGRAHFLRNMNAFRSYCDANVAGKSSRGHRAVDNHPMPCG